MSALVAMMIVFCGAAYSDEITGIEFKVLDKQGATVSVVFVQDALSEPVYGSDVKRSIHSSPECFDLSTYKKGDKFDEGYEYTVSEDNQQLDVHEYWTETVNSQDTSCIHHGVKQKFAHYLFSLIPEIIQLRHLS